MIMSEGVGQIFFRLQIETIIILEGNSITEYLYRLNGNNYASYIKYEHQPLQINPWLQVIHKRALRVAVILYSTLKLKVSKLN